MALEATQHGDAFAVDRLPGRGCRRMDMAFADSLIDHADVHGTLVDLRHVAGGHRLDAYPFVQLHQA